MMREESRNRLFSFTQNQEGGNRMAGRIQGITVEIGGDTSYGSLWEVSFTLKEF